MGPIPGSCKFQRWLLTIYSHSNHNCFPLFSYSVACSLGGCLRFTIGHFLHFPNKLFFWLFYGHTFQVVRYLADSCRDSQTQDVAARNNTSPRTFLCPLKHNIDPNIIIFSRNSWRVKCHNKGKIKLKSSLRERKEMWKSSMSGFTVKFSCCSIVFQKISKKEQLYRKETREKKTLSSQLLCVSAVITRATAWELPGCSASHFLLHAH